MNATFRLSRRRGALYDAKGRYFSAADRRWLPEAASSAPGASGIAFMPVPGVSSGSAAEPRLRAKLTAERGPANLAGVNGLLDPAHWFEKPPLADHAQQDTGPVRRRQHRVTVR